MKNARSSPHAAAIDSSSAPSALLSLTAAAIGALATRPETISAVALPKDGRLAFAAAALGAAMPPYDVRPLRGVKPLRGVSPLRGVKRPERKPESGADPNATAATVSSAAGCCTPPTLQLPPAQEAEGADAQRAAGCGSSLRAAPNRSRRSGATVGRRAL